MDFKTHSILDFWPDKATLFVCLFVLNTERKIHGEKKQDDSYTAYLICQTEEERYEGQVKVAAYLKPISAPQHWQFNIIALSSTWTEHTENSKKPLS